MSLSVLETFFKPPKEERIKALRVELTEARALVYNIQQALKEEKQRP